MGYVTINITLVAFIVASVAYVMKEVWKPEILRKGSIAIFIVAFALNTVLVINRWMESGHAPFSNLYESLIFYAWSVGFVYLVLEYMYSLRIVGALAAVMIMLTLLYASTSDETIRPLMPALQSNWLTVHVITYFIGYAALGISFITAILYLIGRTRPSGTIIAAASGIDFEKLSYKIVAFGFPFLTLGMVTGAVWANKAWGTYWSWDPKETWSLITWLIYLVYLHSPLVLPKLSIISKEKRPVFQSVCLVVAFSAVIFTYLGLSYLPSASDSAHVYQNQ
ncbi:MAG: c-type cytochrome biogenesis protein CcsB [Planctomycetes bacterium RIFCSPHIGHO2_02_FULL_50_42]|uniref:c-type cytochrome biogenesis protein CcsB n=1 Tax=Candidatus Avalokitesvara rifleensis TaxID=3367620 RepID=UPI0008CAE194|nr:c-type cytochrome biogenesis protein CcsB [Candidatus Brocadiales bacterium]OHB89726.1 MAG: c-type cytochrome biogenesis protein CcsB [Planctomycetes bacterium RIFCSPHIGHO2_02_FULL_50_42]OHB91651.1 MAG: c-type cytochrome biogenesis protein CcsB [Planctomycetes bacterium RIFCSPHIGHO2_12_FULL_51_37]OHB94853.1 MAG: c-type cytochrome biogenesis protein CcsB [Planctomycetes bacterium RIFCSPLOWO2_02_FULL_50_16]OHC03128.1 MAG: c-type cytochrome biogenesis protein CcsB [Planctomycetes bacterium RIFC